VDIASGDLADAAALRAALHGIDVLFLINTGPELAVRDAAAADAARAMAVKHLVKLSTMDVEQQSIGTGVWHAQGEAAIRASGIGYTFVQPAGFMVNALFWAPSIKAGGGIRSATGDGKIAFIHSDDIADVATAALMTRKHDGQALPISGPQALSYPEMLDRLSAALGKPLKFAAITDEEARREMLARGEPATSIEYHLSIYRAIRQGRLSGVTDTVERVLGRPAIPFETWVQQNAAAFR
jgi:uncharacterized protein YbjT (DUF2867 family)